MVLLIQCQIQQYSPDHLCDLLRCCLIIASIRTGDFLRAESQFAFRTEGWLVSHAESVGGIFKKVDIHDIPLDQVICMMMYVWCLRWLQKRACVCVGWSRSLSESLPELVEGNSSKSQSFVRSMGISGSHLYSTSILGS